MRKLVVPVAAVCIGFAVPLVLSEMLLRVLQRPFPVVIGWESDRPNETNEFGSRGHRMNASAPVRLVLLGDSQVEAGASPFDQMPEVQLHRIFAEVAGADVGVVSIGRSGWGQDQELLALQTHIEAIHPAVVVLWFTEGNDLWNNTFPTNLPKDGWPKPTFWLEGGELKGPNLPWLKPYRPPGLYLTQAIRRVRRLPNYPTDDEWERLLPPPYRASTPQPGTRPLVQALAEASAIREDEVPYFRDENFETEKTHYSVYLVPESSRLQYALALTRALLLRIESLCEANGARFFVLTTERWDMIHIPETATTFEVNGKGYTLSSASARHLIDGALDGMPTIRVTGTPHNDVVSKTDLHWNVAGNEYVMEWVARELLRQVPIAANSRERPEAAPARTPLRLRP